MGTWVKRSLNVGALTAGAILAGAVAAQADAAAVDVSEAQKAGGGEVRPPLHATGGPCDATTATAAARHCAADANALPDEWTNAHFLTAHADGVPFLGTATPHVPPASRGEVASFLGTVVPGGTVSTLLDDVSTLVNEAPPALVGDGVAALRATGLPDVAALGDQVGAVLGDGSGTLPLRGDQLGVVPGVGATLADAVGGALTDGVAPALVDRVVPALRDTVAPALDDTVGTALDDTVGAVLTDEAALPLYEEVSALLGNDVLALPTDAVSTVVEVVDDAGVVDTTVVRAPAQVVIDISGTALGLLDAALTSGVTSGLLG